MSRNCLHVIYIVQTTFRLAESLAKRSKNLSIKSIGYRETLRNAISAASRKRSGLSRWIIDGFTVAESGESATDRLPRGSSANIFRPVAVDPVAIPRAVVATRYPSNIANRWERRVCGIRIVTLLSTIPTGSCDMCGRF